MIQSNYQILLEIQSQTTKDPLINWQAEDFVKIAVIIILIVLTIIIKIISPRVEHAIIFAFVSSLVAIAIFIIH